MKQKLSIFATNWKIKVRRWLKLVQVKVFNLLEAVDAERILQ